jgi:hypothetical protein
MPGQPPKYFSKWGGKPNFGPAQSLASDDELDAIAEGAPQLLRIRLAQALSTLEYCLRQNPHVSENWKELLEMMRRSKTELKKYIGVRTLPDGTNVEVPMVVDSLRFKYPELKSAVFDLGRVLTEIENFDPDLYKCVKVSKSLQSERGKKSRRGPKYSNGIDAVFDILVADKGLESLRKKNVSDIIKMVQTRWENGACPSDSTIRRAAKIKFSK